MEYSLSPKAIALKNISIVFKPDVIVHIHPPKFDKYISAFTIMVSFQYAAVAQAITGQILYKWILLSKKINTQIKEYAIN